MRKVLFGIGCVLFFLGLFIFVGGLIFALIDSKLGHVPFKNMNQSVYLSTVLFFVGTYLISNNKPEKKD